MFYQLFLQIKSLIKPVFLIRVCVNVAPKERDLGLRTVCCSVQLIIFYIRAIPAYNNFVIPVYLSFASSFMTLGGFPGVLTA